MEQIRMTLTVPDGTRDDLADAAAQVGRSRANLVALLVQDYLSIWRGDLGEH